MGKTKPKKIITSKKKLLEEMAERDMARPDAEMLSRYSANEMLLPQPPKGTKPGRWRAKLAQRMKQRRRLRGSVDDKTIFV